MQLDCSRRVTIVFCYALRCTYIII